MKTSALSADLAAHQRQRDQAAGIIGAMHVLRYAHAPKDHGALRAAKGAGHLANDLGFDAGGRGYRLRAVAGDVLLEVVKILGESLQVLNVEKPFLDDHMHD